MIQTSPRPVVLHLRHTCGSRTLARTYSFDVREARLGLRHMSLGLGALGFGFMLALVVHPVLPF
jgi:hypothetical protein